MSDEYYEYEWDEDQIGLLLDRRGVPMMKVYQERMPYGFTRGQGSPPKRS